MIKEFKAERQLAQEKEMELFVKINQVAKMVRQLHPNVKPAN
jgi:hypothetical protein